MAVRSDQPNGCRALDRLLAQRGQLLRIHAQHGLRLSPESRALSWEAIRANSEAIKAVEAVRAYARNLR